MNRNKNGKKKSIYTTSTLAASKKKKFLLLILTHITFYVRICSSANVTYATVV